MKCKVLDLEQGWHACHKSCANRFHNQIRVEEASFKNSKPLSKRHCKDGDGSEETYEDDGEYGADNIDEKDMDEDDMEHFVKIGLDTAGDLKKTAASPISELPAQNNHNSSAQ